MTELSEGFNSSISQLRNCEHKRRQDELLLRNMATSQLIGIATSTILAILLFDSVSHTNLLAWYFALLGLSILRIGYSRILLIRDMKTEELHRLTIDGLSIISGILWGGAPFLLTEGAVPMVEEAIVFMIAGMTAGAALSFASHLRSVVAFNFPALLTLAVFYASGGSFHEWIMCGVLVLFFFATLSLSRRSNEVLRKSISNELETVRRQLKLEEKEIALKAEMARRTARENEIKETLEKSRRLNTALESIFTMFIHAGQDQSQDLLGYLVERISKVLDVQRVSIWLFTPERNAIECVKLFDGPEGLSEEAVQLNVADFPAYFEAVNSSRIIDAIDARIDPRTCEFEESYLKPLGIYSMLDAPIFSGKDVRGVICCESVNRVHNWSPDEIAFVASAAQFVSMTLMAVDADNLASNLQVALTEAKKASATKSSFLANMSHEVRTPMNGVLGAATALQDTGLTENQKELVNIIHSSGDALMGVLNDILDFSKIEAGHIHIESAPFSIREVINKVSGLHAMKARESGLSFVASVEEGLEDTRVGDSHRLGQVLHNLLSNAIKFTHEGAVQVNVSCKPGANAAGDAVIISVEDSGVGMNAEEAAKVFEKFAQADNSTTRKYGGTGLGLSIVKGLIERMDGSLSLETEKGKGSIFTVELNLPVAVAEEHGSQVGLENSAVTAGLPKKILVAEDNETNRLVLEAFLSKFDVDLVCVENGAEAVEAYETDDFDVILMDVQMPVMDGEQALSAIREIEKKNNVIQRIPIIAATANAMTHQIEHYLGIGFDSHIAKPIRREELLRTLELVNAAQQAAAGEISQRA